MSLVRTTPHMVKQRSARQSYDVEYDETGLLDMAKSGWKKAKEKANELKDLAKAGADAVKKKRAEQKGEGKTVSDSGSAEPDSASSSSLSSKVDATWVHF